MDFINKKIAILGFGVEGQSVANFLIGKASSIVVLDEKNHTDFDQDIIKSYEGRGIEFKWGRIENLSGFDVIFRSPGININLKAISEAKEKGSVISSSIKLFFDLCPCEIIGVTGTKGKGTTSTLIYEMLKESGEDVYLGGNIGNSPLEILENLDKNSKVVLELSSFQLMDLEKSPHIAVMLMVTSDHLDYHKDIYEYINAKRNIFKFQNEDDFAVINQDYVISNESDILSNGQVYKVSRESQVFGDGCFLEDGNLVLKLNGKKQNIIKTDEIALPGAHNFENAAAAIVTAVLAGADIASVKEVLKTFKGLPHRLEFVGNIRGVSFYNDSFSTTPETTIAAIESFSEPKIVILGGSSKRSSFKELGEVINNSDSIKAIIGIGEEWTRIKAELKVKNPKFEIIEGCKDMNEIVRRASEIAEVGDVVLLSPACASFGMFENYKQRGEKFKSEVNLLKN